jgi:hypothetical protein
VLWDGSTAFRWSSAAVTVTVAKHPASLTLTGPATGIAGKQLTLSGVLSTAVPVSASLTVLRTVSNRNGTVTTELAPVAVSGDGSFRFTDTPPVGGAYTYAMRFAGDATFAPAEASHSLTVRGRTGLIQG